MIFLAWPRSRDLHVLELDAEIFRDRLAAGEDRDILQHRFPSIAESRSLHGRNLQGAAQFVDYESCERFALNIFCNNQQRLAALGNLLEQRKQILHRADLLFVDQNVSVVERNFHPLRIGNEVRREIAAIELHSFDNFELGLERLRLFHGDHAILADLLHGFGDDVADGLVVIGRDGANLRDHARR